MLRSAFWPDAQLDYGAFRGPRDAVVERLIERMGRLSRTSHQLGQSLVEIDGETATVETYFTAFHKVPGPAGGADIFVGGRYLDHFEQRGGAWRILRRVTGYDWYRQHADGCDWRTGVFGHTESSS